MAYFDLIYVSAERGREEALLARLEPLVAELYGTHHVRIKRGSGWVQLQREDEPSADVDLREMLEELQQREEHPEWFPPTDKDNACTLSSRLGVDAIYFAAATAADAVQFTRCRGGKIVRNFAYAPAEKEGESGWSEEEGEPEPWEKQWARPRAEASDGPDVTDIGAALGLSGMERSYFNEGFSWDVDKTIRGRRWESPRRSRSVLSRVGGSAPWAVLAALALALVGWVVARRRKRGAR